MVAKDNEYFNRYVLFEYEKIPEYIALLESKFKIRAKEFNEKIEKQSLSEREKNDIVNRPIRPNEKFS
jgi:hypothetical protein